VASQHTVSTQGPNRKGDWIRLGTVGKAHGLRGAFFVSDRDDPLPTSLKKIRVGDDPKNLKDARVSEIAWRSGRPVMSCSLYSDRTAAEVMIGQAVWGHVAELAWRSDQEFLWDEVIGIPIVDPDGEAFGTITSLYSNGPNTIMVVQGQSGKQLELPVVEAYVAMTRDQHQRWHIALVVPASTFDEMWS